MSNNNLYEVRNILSTNNKNIYIGKTFKYGDNYNLTNIYYKSTFNNSVSQNSVSQYSNTNTILINENESRSQDAVDDKTKFIIQTPLMYIPNSIIYLNEKPFLELSFNNEDNDVEISQFRKWIVELEEYIYKLIKRRTSLGITREGLNSIIKPGYNNVSTKILVPINMNISKCLLNDNNRKNKFLFNWEIPVPTYGISIIWIKNIWVKKGRWGLNLFMYASRVMNSHILDPIDFMGETHDNKSIKTVDVINKFQKDEKMSILIGQIPEYTMYFRMVKMGIPKDAVKQKMSLMGIDSRVIDYPDSTPYITVLHYLSNPHLTFINTINTITMPTPPPPPPPLFIGINPGNNAGNDSSNDKRNLLNEISSGGFKLKKVDLQNKSANTTISGNTKKDLVNKLVNNLPYGLKVPSLEDIKGALNRLKKVKLDDVSDIQDTNDIN